MMVCFTESLVCFSFLQGIPLRKVLLQNYLFPNKKNNPKNDLAELGAAGKLCVPTLKIDAATSIEEKYDLCESGGEQDRDWVAVAAVQCRLDREGGTKLFTDLVMSTKNDKIFQESIQLAICLLEGGNTEIQVIDGPISMYSHAQRERARERTTTRESNQH